MSAALNALLVSAGDVAETVTDTAPGSAQSSETAPSGIDAFIPKFGDTFGPYTPLVFILIGCLLIIGMFVVVSQLRQRRAANRAGDEEAGKWLTQLVSRLDAETKGVFRGVIRSKLFSIAGLNPYRFRSALDQALALGFVTISEEAERPPKRLPDGKMEPQPRREEKQIIRLTQQGKSALTNAQQGDGRMRPIEPEPTIRAERGSQVFYGSHGNTVAGRDMNNMPFDTAANAQFESAIKALKRAIKEDSKALKPAARIRTQALMVTAERAAQEKNISVLDDTLANIQAIIAGAAGSALFESANLALSRYFQARGQA